MKCMHGNVISRPSTALNFFIADLINMSAPQVASPNQDKTFIMVKPDGVQRGLVGAIIQR